jgi:hypothetical protein
MYFDVEKCVFEALVRLSFTMEIENFSIAILGKVSLDHGQQ